ncbi:MAG: ASKHA domain-containing protein, partial [Desulfatiglandaceae bacterium]
FEPLAQKIYMELPEPSLEDNLGDVERIIRELRKKTEYQNFEASFHCLQGLASKLRDNDWKVTATITKGNDLWRIMQIEAGDTSDQNYGLAIDVGTTTVVAQLVHMKSGNVVGVVGSHNLQARYGEDVISRMIFACGSQEGLDPLHKAIVKNINNLIRTLTEKKGIDVDQITAIVAAGNTTMSHLLLSLTPCSIRLDPYVPTANIFPQIQAAELNIDINPYGILETMPAVASYVGGDIVAGVIACGIADKPETNGLIDVGTNGEIVIGNNEWLVCCSASAGPAFEGGGIRNGMRATRGAIERVMIDNGKVAYHTIGKAKPRGICGSGLIDCIYGFIQNGIINYEGKFNLSAKDERIAERDGEIQFIVAYSQDTETGKDLTITESDISNIIRSKGAVFAAIKSLTDYVGVKFDEIDTFFVAGGFGTYLDIPKAIGVGLLPDIDPKRIQFVGNSSLMGARIALLSGHAFERSVKIANGMTNIELSTYQPFMDEYIAAMFLPHTDRRLFPSVNY